MCPRFRTMKRSADYCDLCEWRGTRTLRYLRRVEACDKRALEWATSLPYIFCRKGLLSFSSPIVVTGPCPGTTIVSLGSASTCSCKERRIFSYDPTGRSVRPML